MKYSIRHLSDRNYAIWITVIFVILGAVTASHHEMWRDEIQAWLLAKDSTSIIGLFKNLKYEGHPGLWHLCLMPLSLVTRSPVIMQVFHLMVAGVSAYVFSRYSPFPRFQKVLLIFGYFMFYEYSIVCRNYALGVLLLFVFCALFEKRYTKFLIVAFTLFLLAHTSVHCLIITIAIGMSLLAEYLFMRRRNPAASSSKLSIYAGFLIIALGIATSIIQLRPPEDTGFAVQWITKYDPARLKNVFRIVERAFVPIPKFSLQFWNSNILDSVPASATWKSVISGLITLWAVILLLGRPISLFIYVSGTIGLLSFYYAKYYGSMRHHGFLFILCVVSVWVSYHCDDMKRFKPLSRLSSLFRKHLNIPLSLILAAQLFGGVAAAGMDYLYTFSQGKAAARYIQKEAGMDNMTIVGETDYAVSTIAGYLGSKVHYVRGDRLGSFVIWDKDRTANVSPDDILQKARKLAAMKGRDILIILNFALSEDAMSRYALTELQKFEGAVVANEIYYLYLMKAGVSG